MTGSTSSNMTRNLAALILIAVLILGAFIVLRSSAFAGLGSNTLTGTVQVINEDHSSVCILPDGGGEQRCSRLYAAGTPTIEVGDTVTVQVIRIPKDGDTQEGFLLP